MEDELDLSILDSDGSGKAGEVVAMARWGSNLAVDVLPLNDPANPLKDLSDFRGRIEKEILGRGGTKKLSRADLVQFGTGLFRLLFGNLFGNKLQPLYNLPPQNKHVRIQIISNQPELRALPWEYLQTPAQGGGPNLDRSIVRIVPTINVVAPPPLRLAGGRVRVLFVAADPVDQGPVSWKESELLIRNTFASRLPDRFDFVPIPGASREDLFQQLPERNYQILHFAGHGKVIKGVGHLILVDPKTKAQSSLLTAEELCTLLRGRHDLRLVVLAACETAAGNFADDFSVIAETLVAQGRVPAVVAHQLPVFDKTMAIFVGALYEELLRSGDIDRAVGEGRVRLFGAGPAPPLISAASPPASLHWGIPTLYRHIAGSKVFEP